MKFKLTLPAYLISPSIRLQTLVRKIPTDDLEFIIVHMERYMASFFGISDYEGGCLRFQSITKDNDNYALIPEKQKKASNLTFDLLTGWGLNIIRKEHKHIDPCTRHSDHQYLLPFHKTNEELFYYYISEVNNENRRGAARLRHTTGNRCETRIGGHLKTKFYCSGAPFMEKTNYKELDWVERLMYCLKDKLPESINIGYIAS